MDSFIKRFPPLYVYNVVVFLRIGIKYLFLKSSIFMSITRSGLVIQLDGD
jgi:hypothetical protein